MKWFRLLILALCAVTATVAAQDKLLTVDDIFSPDPAARVAFGGSLVRMTWTADGRSFRQTQDGKLVRVNAETGLSNAFYDADRFAAALQATAGMNPEEANRTANSVTLQFDRSESAILLNHAGDLWHYSLAAATLKRLTNTRAREWEEDFSPDGRWVSFVRDRDLYVVDVARGLEKRITNDGAERINNGRLDWIYEEELYGRGQTRGYWWSPDSTRIAFLRLDDTKVPNFVLADDTVTDQRVENTAYPQPGDPNPIVQLGMASIVPIGPVVRWADTSAYDPDDLLIGRVAWRPDSSAVLIQAQNREQTFLDLVSVPPVGKAIVLFRETSPAWVGINDNPAFLPDGGFVWQSERDGWNHLYVYAADGKPIRRLTTGKWEVRGVLGVDAASGWVYFNATKDSHIAENIYRVKIADGTIERLSQGEGSHSALFNHTMTHYVGGWSDANTPPKQRLHKADGALVRTINENGVDALAQYKLGSTDFLRVKNRDGFEMEATMIRPPDFNANKKYPVLIYTYAGPHAPQVRNGWGGSRQMWHQLLAQKGYVIWICDNRSASGKGLESTWSIYKNLGPPELRDIEDGVAYLKSLTFIDPNRIGIWGWSYGGFMTSYALTHSKTFKMGIAGGTVSDWALYDSIYTERYMRTPQNNREGYDRSSVLKAAKDLSGRLLLIHGSMDDNVHMQNTTKLAFELQKAGKQFDLMLYPTQRHGVTNPPQVHHMYTMMTDYVLKNL